MSDEQSAEDVARQVQALMIKVGEFLETLSPDEAAELADGRRTLAVVPVDDVKPEGCTCSCWHYGGCLSCGCRCESVDTAGKVCPCCGADDRAREVSR